MLSPPSLDVNLPPTLAPTESVRANAKPVLSLSSVVSSPPSATVMIGPPSTKYLVPPSPSLPA